MWNTNESALVYYQKYHVTQEAWEEAKSKEREDAVHPCDSWDALHCDCDGACSCHWIPEAPKADF